MPTFERQIDALGGTMDESTEYNAGRADGYSAALEDAMKVGAKADALIVGLVKALYAARDAANEMELSSACFPRVEIEAAITSAEPHPARRDGR